MKYENNEVQQVNITETESNIQNTHIVTVVLGNYEVKVLLTNDNKFVDVIEVGFKKQFFEREKQRIITKFHDIEDFYKD